jgi:hypothetical protein
MTKGSQMRRVPAPAAALGLGLVLGWAVGVRPAGAQEADAAKDEGPEVHALAVRPAAEPVPSLRYRLVPLESELNPGDAAPVYLRLGLEQREEAIRQIGDNSARWLEAPMDEFPVEEARQFVDRWGTRLRQVYFAARRADCDWAYTLPEEREEVINILLPDAQGLRNWARLVALKARAEIAEGKTGEAIETIQTGLAFARHVARGPFLINRLVGLAIANSMLDRVEELMARPDAPNLYWALTALPDPLIDFREAYANEQKIVDWMFPELTDLDAERTPAEWDARLARLFDRMAGMEEEYSRFEKTFRPALRGLALAAFRARLLPEARAFLEERRGSAEGLAEAEMILRYIAGRVAEVRDLSIRPTYLPYAQARALYASGEREEAAHAFDGAPLAVFGQLLASVHRAQGSQARAQRRIAALRAVEAIRMYAASHDGAPPERLDAVEAVPVPRDPTTGEPFAYRREGDAAILSSPAPGDGGPALEYRITIAK